jgi:hypothetical protein
MPLMSDLLPVAATAVRTRSPSLAIRLERLGADLELWMSYLAQSPPWLPDADGLYNQSIFARVASALAKEIVLRQNHALQKPPRPWLIDLVTTWHKRRSLVLTLNYDVLVEKALTRATSIPYPMSYQIPVPPIDARNGLTSYGEARIATVRLFKLHGSVNWYYHGPRAGSHTIYNLLLSLDWVPDSVKARAKEIGGLEPVVVPPVISKDPYFVNDSLKEQWRLAATAARNTTRLFLIGYSLPPADQLMRSFLRTAMVPNDVVIVNPDATVADLAEAAFPKSRLNREFAGGSDAIARFVAWVMGS